MYSAKTNGIRIDVEPVYLEDESEPVESRYFWAYSIDIRNERDRPVQLLSRHWVITDGKGIREEVRGDGVIGKQPVIEPGQQFSYTSGCPLTTPSGIMAGTFQMADSDGEAFSVSIPAFSLDLPNQSRVIN
ncbi:MAG TPA: Co2+/Mg2+ efflux protein ApaG [Afifellaceae bacterium]|nr:Co2+/Mg2+ efflux protein ApaG [Afifellaceae bacterium]